MLRRASLVSVVCILASLAAQAQDKAEVFGAFSYMRFRGLNLAGWEASGQYKYTDWLGVVADFDGHYGSGVSNHTFLFGPQVSMPSRVSPFAHLLLGGAHTSIGGAGTSSFSMALGGGVDTELTDKVRWCLVQADYLLTQFGGGSQNNLRLSTGLIFRF